MEMKLKVRTCRRGGSPRVTCRIKKQNTYVSAPCGLQEMPLSHDDVTIIGALDGGS